MTITNESLKTIAQGNGATTVFSYAFLIPAADEVEVIYTDATGIETVLTTSQYTITGVANPTGGTVTYPLVGGPIAAGTSLTIKRSLPLTQTRQVANQGQFYPQVVEDALDFLTMQVQQVNDLFSRALVVPDTDPSANLTIPNATARALQVLGFDSAGNAIATQPSNSPVSTAMQPVVAASTLALARTAFGLGAAAVEGIGEGLRDNSGSLQVSSVISAVSANQSPVAANHRTQYLVTGDRTFTLPRANTVWSGYEMTITALTGTITLSPNAADAFYNGTSGTSVVFPIGSTVRIWTNGSASGTWYYEQVRAQLVPPQGYLSNLSNTPIILNDVVSATSIFYNPMVGNSVPIYNAAIAVPFVFNTQLTLTLSSSHAASTAYDVFVTIQSGALVLVTGPAWRQTGLAITGATNATPIVITANSHGLSNGDIVVVSGVGGNTAANGSWTVANKTANTLELSGSVGNGAYTTATGQLASRGVGSATTELQRSPFGIYTNKVAMTARNGATTYSVNANEATFLGTILIDTVAGQVTCHRTSGQSRRWGVWNAFNRQPVSISVVDTTASWTYNSATVRAANGAAGNSFTNIIGLPEEELRSAYRFAVQSTPNSQISYGGVGYMVSTALSGFKGYVAVTSGAITVGASSQGMLTLPGPMGSSLVFAVEVMGNTSGAATFAAGPIAGGYLMELRGEWRG